MTASLGQHPATAAVALLEDAKRYLVKSPRTRAQLAWPAVDLTPQPGDLVDHPWRRQIKDPQISRALAATFKPKRGHCYRNAFLALLYSEGLPVTYAEGFAANDFFVALHGWLEFAGRIVDPTWAYEDMVDATYFAGLRLTLPEALGTWRDTDAFPFVASYGRSGLDHPGYNRAFYDALAFNQGVLVIPPGFRSNRAYYETLVLASRVQE
jgi:hypothetical protein